jgi:hypothetical protein
VKPPERPFQVGDIVRHTGEFLRSVGWIAGAPINGEVLAVDAVGDDDRRHLLRVAWSDGTECGIAAGAVEFCPRGRALTAARRVPRDGKARP